ncbi:hypothetical protein AB4254_18135 [Vibrio breoganii]
MFKQDALEHRSIYALIINKKVLGAFSQGSTNLEVFTSLIHREFIVEFYPAPKIVDRKKAKQEIEILSLKTRFEIQSGNGVWDKSNITNRCDCIVIEPTRQTKHRYQSRERENHS